MRQIFFDIETTGFKYHEGQRVVEVAAVEVVDGLKTGQVLHLYFNPQREVPPEAAKIHGLTTEFLKDKPIFMETAGEIEKFMSGADEVLIHNGAGFDIPFMDAELKGNGMTPMSEWNVGKFTDTLKVARAIAGSKKNDLDSLCDKYKVDRSQRTSHGAVIDCELLVEVWQKMTAHINFNGPDLSQRQEPIRRVAQLPPLRVIHASDAERQAEQAYMDGWKTKPQAVRKSLAM